MNTCTVTPLVFTHLHESCWLLSAEMENWPTLGIILGLPHFSLPHGGLCISTWIKSHFEVTFNKEGLTVLSLSFLLKASDVIIHWDNGCGDSFRWGCLCLVALIGLNNPDGSTGKQQATWQAPLNWAAQSTFFSPSIVPVSSSAPTDNRTASLQLVSLQFILILVKYFSRLH